MTAAVDTRKRSREDDISDSTPLSKRINNLHINNNDINFHGNRSNSHMNNFYNPSIHGSNGSVSNQPTVDDGSSNHSLEHLQQNNDDAYSPELDQYENPFYFNKNKLLFELHAERLRRYQQQPM